MIIGYAATALVTPLYSYVVHPMQVLVFRFLERVGKGIRTAQTVWLQHPPQKIVETGKSFGFPRRWIIAEQSFDPLIAAAVLFFLPKDNPGFQYKTIFWLAAIPAVVGVFCFDIFGKGCQSTMVSAKTPVSIKKLPKNFLFFPVDNNHIHLGKFYRFAFNCENKRNGYQFIMDSVYLYDFQYGIGIFGYSDRKNCLTELAEGNLLRSGLVYSACLFHVWCI